MAVIKASGLTKRYGEVEAVSDLSFEVGAGVVAGFLGPNGAGKTTTIRMLLGLTRPDAGEALVFGARYGNLARPMLRIGAAIDGASFHPRRSARNHLRMVAAASGISSSRVAEVLDLVELDGAAGRKAGGYSLGMKQRLALASALLGDPELLILDEPANGLDPAGIRWLREFLRSFADRGNTVLVSSHVLGEVAHLADEAIVVDRGRLVVHSSIAELTKDARSLEDVFLELTTEAR